MKGKKYENLEANQTGITLASFMEAYNNSLPKGFPAASVSTLKEFQEAYPSLFKNDEWMIDKHRKRYMDWLFSYMRKKEYVRS